MGETFRLLSVHFRAILRVYFYWRTKQRVCGRTLTHYVMDAMFTLKNGRAEKVVLSNKWKEKEGILAN